MFQKIASNYENNIHPIILIDISGSTCDKFKDNKKILDYEFELAQKLYLEKYESVHLITWSDKARLYENISIKNFTEIVKKTRSGGGTYLKCGFDQIKSTFFDPHKITEVIVITDGEVNDNKTTLCNKLNELNKYNICIKIIAVEPNNKNYLDANISVGNDLYRIIRDNNMSRLVNRFSVYNKHETEFVNMSNPNVKDGYVPYNDKMFHISYFNHFVSHIHQEVTNLIKDDSKDNEGKIIKFSQELSLSIYHLTKDKAYSQQIHIINLFCNMFKNTIFYEKIKKILHQEVTNQISGKISTFAELRKCRYTKIENTNIDLMTDTQKTICGQTNNLVNYSFVLLGPNKYRIIKTLDTDLANIQIGFTTYHRSGIKVGNYLVPILFDFDNSSHNDAALQWLKFNYSRRLNISMTNEYIYYYLLCDALVTKNTELENLYSKYVALVLNDQKYGNEITILKEMIKNNMITIPYGILQDAANYFLPKLKPLTLYYLVCHKFLLKYLNHNQYVVDGLRKYCSKDIITDLNLSDDINWGTVNKLLDQLIPPLEIVDFNSNDRIVTKPHNYLDLNVECPCDNGQTINDETYCNLCGNVIESTKINKNLEILDLSHLDKKYLYDTSKHIHLGNLDGLPDDELIYVDQFNTNYESYSLDNTIIIDPISNSRLKISTQEEFVNYTYLKYPFLKDIDMKNIALCGGFVRSILLKQQMKDFDFFFYGLENSEQYIERVKTLTYD